MNTLDMNYGGQSYMVAIIFNCSISLNPNHVLSFLVADDGIGVRESLSENEKYAEIGEAEALRICVKDAITG